MAIPRTQDGTPIRGIIARTAGELCAALASLPPHTPLHHRGNMGEFPPGITMVILDLASAKGDPTYFAAIKVDQVWSKPKRRKTFGKSFEALCVVN